MNDYVLDTDTVSLAQRNHVTVLANIRGRPNAGHSVGLAVVTVEEQFDGWTGAQKRARRPADYARFSFALAEAIRSWGRYTIHPQTVRSLATFDRLVPLLSNVGRRDLRIASVALGLGATVVTRNLRDFGRVPGLLVEDWSV